MLARAREKFPGQDGHRIGFHRSSIEELPFKNAVFDGLMVNQVLHHLEDDADAGYPRIDRLLSEFSRVLKPGGVLTVNSCSIQQLKEGFWYYNLIPEETVGMCRRHVPLDKLQELIEQNGFEFGGRLVPVDAVIQGKEYFNARGPLEAAWRDGDSIWATVSRARTEEVLTRVERMGREGSLEDYMREHDQKRKSIGQVTFLFARRKRS